MQPFRRSIQKAFSPSPPMVMDSTEPYFSQPQELDQLVKKFAPLMYFHPEEEAMPVTVEWYLERVSLVNAQNKTKVPASLSVLLETSENNGNYYLEPNAGVSMFENRAPFKTYVKASTYGAEYMDLQYWFLFPEINSASAHVKWLIDGNIKGYEGHLDLDPLGRLNGKWDRITVRVNRHTTLAESVFFPQSGRGNWQSAETLEWRENQVIVYVSKDNCGFYPFASTSSSDKKSFDLYSSQLDFSLIFESAEGRELDFSNACEIISADYLEDEKPLEPLWLGFKHHWGNPSPGYLSTASMKRTIPGMFGKEISFLLSKELLDNLVIYLQPLYSFDCLYKCLPPSLRDCWQEEVSE